MFPMRSVLGSCTLLLARLGLVLTLISCGGQVASTDRDEEAAVEMPRSAPTRSRRPSRPSDPRSALAAIRTERTECREKAFGPPPLEECDARASDASYALLPRSPATDLKALQ